MNKITKAALPAMALCGAIFAVVPVSAAEIDTSNLNNVIPSAINIDAKESAVTCEYVSTLDENYGCISKKVLEKIDASLAAANITIDANTYNEKVDFKFDGIYDFTYTLSVKDEHDQYNSVFTKDIAITYSNTPSETTAAMTAMQEKIGANFTHYLTYEPGTSYNVSEHTTNIEKAVQARAEDDTISVSSMPVGGGISDKEAALGFTWESVYTYMAFKNDVLYAEGIIISLIGPGYTLSDGAVITVSDIEEKGDVYATMKAKLASEGHNEVLGAYELQLVGNHTGNITATFNVDTKYNGKTVVILHKKSDNTYEEFEKVVTNGKVSVEVSSLSPFAVALKDSPATQTATTTGTTSEIKSPDTGAAPKSDNSGATASVLTTVASAVLALGAFAIAKKITKAEE